MPSSYGDQYSIMNDRDDEKKNGDDNKTIKTLQTGTHVSVAEGP